MAAEEFTCAMNGVREFNRLQDRPKGYQRCPFLSIRPRSGLDSETEKNGAGLSTYSTFPQSGKRCAKTSKR